MRRTSKTLLAVMTLGLVLSFVSHVWGDFGYETVGGEISQTNFITNFIVPAVVIVGIVGFIVILVLIRTKPETDAHKTA